MGRSGPAEAGRSGTEAGEAQGGRARDRESTMQLAIRGGDGGSGGSGVGGPSGRVYPADWATKTAAQKHRYNQRRRK